MADAREAWLDWRLALRDHGPGLVLCLAAGTWLLHADWPWVAALSSFAFCLGALLVEVVLLRRLVSVPARPAPILPHAEAVEPERLLALLLVALGLAALVLAVREPAVLARLEPAHPAPERALGLCLGMLPLGWLVGRVAMQSGWVGSGRWFTFTATELVSTPDGGALYREWTNSWRRLPDAASVERFRRAEARGNVALCLQLIATMGFSMGPADALIYSWTPAILPLFVILGWLGLRLWLRALRDSRRVFLVEPGEDGMDWGAYAKRPRRYGRRYGFWVVLLVCLPLSLLGGQLSSSPWVRAALGVDWFGVGLLYNSVGFALCLGWLIALQPLGVADRLATSRSTSVPEPGAVPHG